VHKWLVAEEAQEMAVDTAYVLHKKISASQLITIGLDFEEQQYIYKILFISSQHSDTYSERHQLAVDLHSLGPHLTDEQKTRLQNRCNVLSQKITSWINVQHLYMLGLHILYT
jgi:tRNA A22 N-methylase